MPIIKVVAKPLIGPLPKINSTTPVKNVVILESNIDERAFLKPSVTAKASALPALSSSRIRSKIITLASIAIPMVRTIPAIPGKVSTECKLAKTPNISKMLNNNAKSAYIPARP